jgi:cysteine desulfurase
MKMKYFDCAASTLMSEGAMKAYIDASTQSFGNANSLHDEGDKAKRVLQFSRQQIANMTGSAEDSVIFTSGGTESNELAIDILLHNAPNGKNHIILSKLEHASIHHKIETLQKKKLCEVDYISHQKSGAIELEHLKALIKTTTALIIVQHANSEIGVLQEIDKIRNMIGEKSIFIHVDCVQSFGKIDLTEISKYADSIAISSHKIYGPKGVGACIFPKIKQLRPIYEDVSHEF